jgi:hypothetical protein
LGRRAVRAARGLGDTAPAPSTLQVLLDDPDIPGYQPALPEGFDLDEFAKQVAKEGKK